ncbi:Alpha-(1,3)-fucosyltransferase 11 [Modicella reniformis]|uniref:Fucosyltransferase n=1 Tax=Modicella reniformis TaxID=1440133 RepID=A0A9P6MAY5_9FUNG|nr:Alpha-(1,3)-fucosyltransferase 11 [Modicella reniformis]
MDELFGSSDSDSGSEVMEAEEKIVEEERQTQEQPVPAILRDDSLALETDLIFQSIMGSDYDDTSDNGDDHLLSNPHIHATHTPQPRHEPHPHIPGFCLHTHVLSDADENKLMTQITERNFFKAGQQNQAMCFGKRDLAWLEWLEERMIEKGVLVEPYCHSEWSSRRPLFDQSIMNLYYPGNGIKPHVDLARFEDGIVIISLLSAINMDFYPALNPMSPNDPPQGHTPTPSSVDESRNPSFTVRLEPGSIISMQGSARYEWEHGIQETTQDLVNGEWIQRKIRVSVTLRKMRMSAWEVGSVITGAALELVSRTMADQGKEYFILWWSKWFDTDRYEGRLTNDCGLPYTCRHTLDRSKYNESKVIVYHDWNSKDLAPLNDRPQPQAYQQKYMSLFTYKFTYHFGSDFIGSYFTSGLTNAEALINLVSRPPFRTLEQKNQFRKTGFHELESRPLAPVIWVVSNCKAENGRHFMVNQLMKFINIDIYGRCIPNRAWPKRQDGKTEMTDEELVGHYKFYLAIENSNCEDYVTEKLVRAFGSGSVPVVDGPEDYSRLTPSEKSLIRYDDHGSPEQLANFLKSLDNDDESYLKYLSFRSAHTTENTDENGQVRIHSPETFNRGYKERLLPWFVDNWDIDSSGLSDKKTTEWPSHDGSRRTSRAKYGMQWGPDYQGGLCALCRVAHDLTEGKAVIDPTKRLAIDTTCRFRKFYYTSWIMAFYPYWTLFALVMLGVLLSVTLTGVGRRAIRRVVLKAGRGVKGRWSY